MKRAAVALASFAIALAASIVAFQVEAQVRPLVCDPMQMRLLMGCTANFAEHAALAYLIGSVAGLGSAFGLVRILRVGIGWPKDLSDPEYARRMKEFEGTMLDRPNS